MERFAMMPMTMPAATNAITNAIMSPVVILVLCAFAGLGTVLMLPGRKETSWAKVGGVVTLAVGLILGALLVRYAAALNQGGMNAYFWVFSAVALAGAVRVITHPRPVYSALYFVLTVMASAGLFILMWAEFMAAALVVIYAGAILVTYVFVIMLAQQSTIDEKATGLAEYDTVSREPIVAAAIGFALMGVFLFVLFDKADGIDKPINPANVKVDGKYDGSTQQLGQYLFNDQLVNLELAGLILTISMVGAIVITRRRVVSTDVGEELVETPEPETLHGPATPVNDNPHSIPVYGTDNPRAKAYPET
jgi:NADH-quinone oxidoreductase subunit J